MQSFEFGAQIESLEADTTHVICLSCLPRYAVHPVHYRMVCECFGRACSLVAGCKGW
jgi:hypothetical protein